MATIPDTAVRISRGAFTARPVRKVESQVAGRRDPATPRRLGDLLVECHMISPEQLQQGLAIQQEQACFLGKALVELKLIDPDTLVTFLAKQTNIPHLNLTEYQIQRDVLELLPLEFCRQRHVVAIDKLGSMLTIAMVNPLDLGALEDVRAQFPHLRIKPMLCSWQHLEKVLDRRAPRETVAHNPFETLGFTKRADSEPAARELKTPAVSPPSVTAPREEICAPVAELDVSTPISESTSATLAEAPIPPALDIFAAIADDAPATGSAWIDAFFGEDLEEEAAPTASDVAELPIQDPAPAPEEDARHQAILTPPEEAAAVEPDMEIPHMHLADVVRESIRDAVGLVAKAIRERDSDAPPSAQELSGSLRGAVYSAIKGLGDRVSSESALDAIGDDFPEIHAATQQALREAEAVVVAEARLHELEAAHRRKQIPFALPRYHSVHSLGKPEQECSPQATDEVVLSALESERPLAEYRFDDYFVDKSNSFTFSLCRAVAEKPGRDYNPFFLYGSVGVGKTHLINAIGNFAQSRDQNSRVGYVSAIFFASRLDDAIQDGALKAFRDNYCHWDVLILDDMQFLAGRVEAQEEFFHIFNALHQAGRQIIIAGDQAPDRLGLLEERLVSRFSGGIVAHLRPPNYDTRMAILRHHVRARGMAVPEDVLAFIGKQITNDVRKLTGSLRKVLAFADLVGQDITLAMATEILGHLDVAEAV